MASAAVVCGGLVALGLFLLQVIGVGTDHWLILNLVWRDEVSAGLFRICEDRSVRGISSRVCQSYSGGFNYYATTGLSVIGSILLFVNVIISFVRCVRARPGRHSFEHLSGVWCVGACCSIASVILFHNTQYHNVKTVLSLTSPQLDTKLGYSSYLVAVAGGCAFIAAIIMCVVARQMDPPQTVTPSAAPSVPQVFVIDSGVAQQGPTVYPKPGYEQPGYQQSVNPQPGYPQDGNLKPGYPQDGNPQPGYPKYENPEPGYPQSETPQQGYPQSVNPQPGYQQTVNPQPGYPQDGNLQPGCQQS